MIIRATFRNIYSFNKETSISFVAGKGTTKPEHVDRAEGRDDISILKAGVVYGANASGKSNMVKAIFALNLLVHNGQTNGLYHPFKTKDNIGKPSKIEIEFKQNGKYYAYGVEYDSKKITEEWLYEINKRTDKLVFNRQLEKTVSEIEYKYNYEFTQLKNIENDKQFILFIAKGTPANACFVPEYLKRNGVGINCIKEVYNWFDNFIILNPNTTFNQLTFTLKNQNFKKKFNEFLSHFNTGIEEIKLITITKKETEIPIEHIETIENSLNNNQGKIYSINSKKCYYFEKNSNGEITIYKLQTIHKIGNGEENPFDLTEESDGTIRLFDFIPLLIVLTEGNFVILIDELDRSMHTMLTKEIFIIYSKLLQKKNIQSQFICTTHESNLLSLESLREDEIWFAEKDETGSTHFTSLCEFEHRDNNKQKGYLNGRYGAIPFYGDINNIIND